MLNCSLVSFCESSFKVEVLCKIGLIVLAKEKRPEKREIQEERPLGRVGAGKFAWQENRVDPAGGL